MALPPHVPDPPKTPTAADIESAFTAHVDEIERVVDAWLVHKDRSQPQQVPLPRVMLDAAHLAEIVRRYQAAGWGHVEVKDGLLHLAAAAPAAPAQG